MRLKAVRLISRCIYLLRPNPHLTAPSRWPCVGGQSTTISLRLGGCWWWRGCRATMITRPVRQSTTPWEPSSSSWPLSAIATASTQHWTGCHEKRETLSMHPPWAETTPHRKPSMKEEIMWSSRYLPLLSSVKRQHYRLMLSQSGHPALRKDR